MMRSWLREAVAGQFGLDEVDNGQVALEWIASGVPRLVVVGKTLTDMSGGELLQRAAPFLGASISTFLLADSAGQAADVDESQINIYYRLVPTMQGASMVRPSAAYPFGRRASTSRCPTARSPGGSWSRNGCAAPSTASRRWSGT